MTDAKKPYAIQVLGFILGGGATSYLYNSLVHEQKIASWVGISYDPESRGPTAFWVAAQPTPEKSLQDLEQAIDQALKQFASGNITEKQVADAKRRMLAGLDYEKDPSFAGVGEIGSALAVGLSIDDVEMWPNRIEAVTLAQVQEVAQEILQNPQHVTSLLLPIKKA